MLDYHVSDALKASSKYRNKFHFGRLSFFNNAAYRGSWCKLFSRGNVIKGNVDHSDGPTGAERHGGIAPSFVGGIAILNGTYNNTIASNQVSSSAAADLVWAQAIPDPNSAIGVAAEPPVIHCNVTVSEGGRGVANHNGNVWSGNTAKHIDACISQQ